MGCEFRGCDLWGCKFRELSIRIALCGAVGVSMAAGTTVAKGEEIRPPASDAEVRFPGTVLPVSAGPGPARAARGAAAPLAASPTATIRVEAPVQRAAPPAAVVPRALVSTTRLAGRAVVTPQNTRVGTLHEFAFAPEVGAVYAVVAAIGADGGRLVVVPAADLRLLGNGLLELDTSERVVADLPEVQAPRRPAAQTALVPESRAEPYRLSPD